MEVLKKLSPAQTKVILAPNSSKISELLRLTFIDLVLKRVIVIREAKNSDGTLEILRGEKFDTCTLKYHDRIFTEIFNDTPELCITIDELMKLVRREIGGSKKYKWRCLIEPELSKYFHPKPLFGVFGSRIKLNDEGLALKNDIEKYLNRATPRVRKKSPKISEAKDIYESLGSNFLLINGYESKYLKNFFHKVRKEESKKKKMSESADTNSHGVCVSDPGGNSISTPILDGIILYEILEIFESFDSIVSSNFETSFGGFDDSKPGWFEGGFDWSADSLFGSDSGGDSGCSGCSGCGGCGGGD